MEKCIFFVIFVDEQSTLLICHCVRSNYPLILNNSLANVKKLGKTFGYLPYQKLNFSLSSYNTVGPRYFQTWYLRVIIAQKRKSRD